MARRKRSAVAEVKREAIKTAAKQLFGTRGYVSTTMRQIARAVSMEGGSLYYHFRSKEELLAVILSEGNERLIDAARQAMAQEPAGPAETLRAIMTAHMKVLVQDRTRFMIATTDLNRLTRDRRRRIIAQRNEYESLVRNTIARGIEERIFRPCDAKIASYGIIAVMNSVAFWFKESGQLTLQEIADEQINLILKGLIEPEAYTCTE